MKEDYDQYISYTISLNNQLKKAHRDHHDAICWLAFSVMLNIALIITSLWEKAQ